MEKELEQIGLNEKEAKVYVASLQLGKASAAEVAKKSGLKRPTTYFTLESLMKKGLMSSTHEGKKQFFIAENPDRLVDVFKAKKDEIARQEQNLGKLIPSLKKMTQADSSKPIVKYYKGKEGAMSMVKNLMEFQYKNEIVWMAYPADTINAFFSSEELRAMNFSRTKKQIRTNAIYVSDTELDNTDLAMRKRVDNDEYPISADIAVYGDIVRLTDFKDGTNGIVIENAKIASTLKTIFKLAWERIK